MPIDITVIIPTYKPQDYLKECIRSIAQQTLDKNRFELIIVLNGCNEPYRQNIQSWLQPYPQMQVRLIQTDTPGVSNARNIGLDHAHGEYICFIDDDDWISDNYLENLLSKSDIQNSIVCGFVSYYKEEEKTYEPHWIGKAFHRNQNKQEITLIGGRSFMSVACCKIIPQTVIGCYRFNTKLSQGEDAFFMASISHNIKHIRLSSPDAIYYVRARNMSSSRVRSQSAKIYDNVKLSISFIKLYLSNPSRYNIAFFANRIISPIVSIFK